ncbi:MAG: thioredoxin family protein [Desulforhopalus sp.]
MSAIIVTCPTCKVKNRISDTKQHLTVRCGRCKEKIDVHKFVLPVVLDDHTMDGFLKSAQMPILVDFYSPTCGPCQTLAPLLVEMTRHYLGKIIISKVDTSQNLRSAEQYRVKAVPTLIFFRDSKVLEEIVGLPEKKYLQQKLDQYSV